MTGGRSLNPCFQAIRLALAVGLVLTLLTVAAPTFAGPLEDGRAAFLHGDYARAMRLLRPVAEGGDARAQFLVGKMYESGWGMRQSSAQAAVWYQKSAEQGYDLAQSSLGLMYSTGDGVPQNYAKAMKWTLMAAKQGNMAAQSAMSMFYKHGLGVPQNYILAYMWVSVTRYDPEFEPVARKDLNELAPHMAPSQIAEAERLALQCMESHYEDCPANREKVATSPSRKSSQVRVPLKMSGGTFLVPVEINGKIVLDFILDSGASDVTLPDDVFTTLKRTGTIEKADIVGQRTYILADGSKTQSVSFTIRSLKVGDIVIENVSASVAPSQGVLLLGQSFLQRFKSWSIDNAAGGLLLETR
jgi:clan AA aspartic protease (TIGR02281 family)